MFGTAQQHRWDGPFPRTGCNLICTAEYILGPAGWQRDTWTRGLGWLADEDSFNLRSDYTCKLELWQAVSCVALGNDFRRDVKRGIRRRQTAVDRALQQNFLNLFARYANVQCRSQMHAQLLGTI